MLTNAMVAARMLEAVPLPPDEATARQLLRRPPVVARDLELDEDSSSPRRARLFADETCREWELGAVRDDAVLVASELVANAVAHARTPCRLDMRLDRLGLTIAVRDYDSHGIPRSAGLYRDRPPQSRTVPGHLDQPDMGGQPDRGRQEHLGAPAGSRTVMGSIAHLRRVASRAITRPRS